MMMFLPSITKAHPKCLNPACPTRRGSGAQEPNSRDLGRLLSLCDARPYDHRSAKKPDEFPPFHSITLSGAVVSRVFTTSAPSCAATRGELAYSLHKFLLTCYVSPLDKHISFGY
jgi:hypothetical protein